MEAAETAEAAKLAKLTKLVEVTTLATPAAETLAIYNLPSSQLNLMINSSNDPLFLGAERPPPPEDPDTAENNDETIQKTVYCYQLLTESEKISRDKMIAENGYMDIDDVRMYFETQHIDVMRADPTDIIYIDSHTNYKIFIVDENIYTREELYEHYAFFEFKTQPEAFFEQRIVGEFVVGDGIKLLSKSMFDSGWKFYHSLDLLRMAKDKRKKLPTDESKNVVPRRIAKSKVYFAGERFRRFLTTQDVMSTLSIAAQSSGSNNLLVQSLCGVTAVTTVPTGQLMQVSQINQLNQVNADK